MPDKQLEDYKEEAVQERIASGTQTPEDIIRMTEILILVMKAGMKDGVPVPPEKLKECEDRFNELKKDFEEDKRRKEKPWEYDYDMSVGDQK